MGEKLKKAFANRNKFDELNEKGYVRISAKTPEAKALEMSNVEKDAQGFKAAFKRGDDVIGRFKGGGKLGALAAVGMAGYQALKGEPVQAQEMIKAGAEALNPLPFDLDEVKDEMGKLSPEKALKDIQENKKQKEEKALKGALEFAKELEKMKKKSK